MLQHGGATDAGIRVDQLDECLQHLRARHREARQVLRVLHQLGQLRFVQQVGDEFADGPRVFAPANPPRLTRRGGSLLRQFAAQHLLDAGAAETGALRHIRDEQTAQSAVRHLGNIRKDQV